MANDPPKKETAKAKLFCEAYLAMGTERSLEKLSNERIDGIAVGLRWLKAWSTTFGWQERAEAYDAEQLERKRRARDAQIEEMNEELAQLGKEERIKIFAYINKLLVEGKMRDAAAVQYAKLVVEVQKQALGDDKQRLEITGKDGGKVEMDVVVETFWGRGTDPRRKVEEIDEEPTEGEESPGIDVEFGDDGNDEPWEDEEDSDSFDETNS